ncbi:hypothetical protein Pint_06744 [Pistacia integerrima]|uniref:Uncharacterized protein n=1 Tax=Pistacia integerrima TaxID=434235 RepID=A0ACC0XU58_9ROSI|nr:hypothetical protein Pint_06744 [Pistacia integerrima]
MADVVANQVGGSFGDANDAQKNVFDLGAFVGDLTFEEDASGDDISLEGLAKELEECKNYDVVENILSKGTTLREYTKGVENDLCQVEMDSIQDYIKESDNFVSLHDQICDCDAILSQMETSSQRFSGMLILAGQARKTCIHLIRYHLLFVLLNKSITVTLFKEFLVFISC